MIKCMPKSGTKRAVNSNTAVDVDVDEHVHDDNAVIDNSDMDVNNETTDDANEGPDENADGDNDAGNDDNADNDNNAENSGSETDEYAFTHTDKEIMIKRISRLQASEHKVIRRIIRKHHPSKKQKKVSGGSFIMFHNMENLVYKEINEYLTLVTNRNEEELQKYMSEADKVNSTDEDGYQSRLRLSNREKHILNRQRFDRIRNEEIQESIQMNRKKDSSDHTEHSDKSEQAGQAGQADRSDNPDKPTIQVREKKTRVVKASDKSEPTTRKKSAKSTRFASRLSESTMNIDTSDIDTVFDKIRPTMQSTSTNKVKGTKRNDKSSKSNNKSAKHNKIFTKD